MSADTQLPEQLLGACPQLRADGHRRRAMTPYDKALALMKIFQHGAVRLRPVASTSAPTPTRSTSSCSTRTAGFCEQYAAAFAELARSVGLPTRVAVGYQRGHARPRRPAGTSARRTRTRGPRCGSARRSAGTASNPRPAAPIPSPVSAAAASGRRATRRPRPTTTAERRRHRRPRR